MSITIVGAGLAGLAIAYRLSASGRDVQLLEANPFAGGRIQPAIENGHQDLGPTWVWPDAQPVIKTWLAELGLELFDQFDTGSGLVDNSAQNYAQQQSLPSQYGIARIEGGTHALIDALEAKLENTIRYEHVVQRCERVDNQWQLTVTTPENNSESIQIHTDQLVIATPPRLAAAMLDCNGDEALTNAIQVLNRTETWMAPHAKIVALYESAFWREAGLSGRVASQVGPLVEIHDHSGPDGIPAALFGFAGVPAQVRHAAKEQFVEAIKHQLQRCFGADAPDPIKIIIKDWAFEPYITTDADRNGTGAHPHALPNIVQAPHCDRSLWFGVSETSQRSPGLIEGALARADDVANDITSIV